MKILHLSSVDIQGGASRGTYWLHQGLRQQNVESILLVGRKLSDDPSVIGSNNKLEKGLNLFRPTLDKIPLLPYQRKLQLPSELLLSPEWLPSQIPAKVAQIKPDIINLHWICNGYLAIEDLSKFRNIPLVWTVRDMWPFTGGCHYSQDCTSYIEKCGSCPILDSTRENDLSRKIWKRKTQSWKNLNLTIVCISNWLADCARQSNLFKNHRIEVISNALDETVYKPIPKKIAREILNIPQNKKILLFGALQATQNQRKGFQYLVSALRKLSDTELQENMEIVIFGASGSENSLDLKMKINYQGTLYDDITLALLYSSADVMIVPSTQEAFGKTAMESLACGTPVVCFDSTGLKDIVEHKRNGYRSTCFDSDDLAKGITWILEDEERWEQLSKQAREKVEQEFTLKVQTSQYLKLYQEILC
jgi:glycosyltransferase involved in cell wall biosynthesis